jgi:CHASE3 domain sensor protein
MSKLTEQIPAIAITVLLLGGLGGAGAYYVTNTVLPEMEARRTKEIADLRDQHQKEIKAANDESLKKIAELNKLLSDATAKREADMFRTQEEVAKLNTDRMDALAEAIAKKVQPFNPLPKTPQEAERAQNEQVDKVSSRLNERIQPILAQMASDQGKLTRDDIARYSQNISDQVSVVLTTELAKNAQLNSNLQSTQAVARDSLALSHELGALYISSFKDQGVLTRILTLPANVLRDASHLSILNSSEKKQKETELLAKLAEVQKRLDAELAKAPTK